MKELSIRGRKIKSFDGIIGKSRQILDVLWKIEVASGNDITVLITGESGTGKELIARSIHKRSKRSRGPFIAVNTGAMTRELAASELFGHEKGAFTGATEFKDGMFDLARGGTLFLDEVSTMDYKTQTSILRILENREFRRIGGKNTLRTDARIITATNKDLRKAIEEGIFRKDLFFRLNVFTIHLPPLRERWDDIPLLVKEFIKVFNKEAQKEIKQVSHDALEYLIRYDWPGNIRELKNTIQRAILLTNTGTIRPEHLPLNIISEDSKKKNIVLDIGLPLKEIERRYIERTLWWVKGNKLKAAQILKISRRALYNKIEEYNL